LYLIARCILIHLYYLSSFLFFFFFNATATTEIYTLSLHDALPIWEGRLHLILALDDQDVGEITADGLDVDQYLAGTWRQGHRLRSEEHTSELQSRGHLVCRLLLEKKKKKLEQMMEQQHLHSQHIYL